MNNSNSTTQTATPVAPTPLPEFALIDSISSLMDNQFRIPFTQTRFGVDFLIGLIPGIGDWLSFGISSALVFAMMRRGIGVGMLFKMLGNITLDTLIGFIPIIGDLFDLHYKANRRNVALLKQYYVENPNPPTAKRSFFIISLMFLAVLVGILMGMIWVMGQLWDVLVKLMF